jgi:predicted O-methyltransferase YrrM
MDNNLDDYIASHIDAEPPMLRQLYRRTHLTHLYPRMCSGHVQGRILTMLTRMIQPKRILELGAFTGYSALCFAEGMPEDAQFHTVEIDDEHADELRDLFDSSPWGERMHLHIGDALEVVPTIDELWDLVFIDANKRNYLDYYKQILPRVNNGGYIIADNTLWDSKVTQMPDSRDAQTIGIMAFNDHVAADPTVEKVILPLRDGMTIIRKK